MKEASQAVKSMQKECNVDMLNDLQDMMDDGHDDLYYGELFSYNTSKKSAMSKDSIEDELQDLMCEADLDCEMLSTKCAP